MPSISSGSSTTYWPLCVFIAFDEIRVHRRSVLENVATMNALAAGTVNFIQRKLAATSRRPNNLDGERHQRNPDWPFQKA
jgi:hypothetical protein